MFIFCLPKCAWNKNHVFFWYGSYILLGWWHNTLTSTTYRRKVLGLSSGIGEPGNIKWDLSLCLLLAWIVVYFCIWKGIRSSGKVISKVKTKMGKHVFCVTHVSKNPDHPFRPYQFTRNWKAIWLESMPWRVMLSNDATNGWTPCAQGQRLIISTYPEPEEGHLQVRYISIKNVPTAVLPKTFNWICLLIKSWYILIVGLAI